MTLENPWSSSTSIICLNDYYTMELSAKLPLSTCVGAEIKRKKTKNGRSRSSKQVTEDDMPLAILAYQKGYYLHKRTSLPNPPLSSPTRIAHRKKRHASSPPVNQPSSSISPRKKNQSSTTTTKSKNHHSTVTPRKEKNCHGYRHSFPVTENEHASLRYIHHHHIKNKKTEHHRHRTLRQSIESTCKLIDENDRSSTSDTPTVQIHPPVSEKKDPTTSDACTTTTTTTPEPSSCSFNPTPTCFSCLATLCWSILPLKRMFLKKKKTNSLIYK